MLLKRSAVILMLAALSACAGGASPKTADAACTALRALTFANPKAGQENADDYGNRYDTKQTIDEVIEHNVRWRAMCER